MENNFFVRSILIGISSIGSVLMMNNSKNRIIRFIGLLLYLVILAIALWF